MRRLFGVALLVLLAVPARAAAPAMVPVQGYLTDTGGAVIDGTVSLHFAIYDVAVSGSPLWEETQSILAQDGFFSAYLGQATTLALSLFRDHGMVWLGVAVDGDSEMPRALMGSAPFAAYAEYGAGGGGAGIVFQGGVVGNRVLKTVSEGVLAETSITEQGGRLTGIIDPTDDQDAATKHYVDLNPGCQPLAVQKVDSATLLGRYLGFNPTPRTGTDVSCDDLVYLSGQGLPVGFRSRDCTLNPQIWYYAGSNCTSSVLNTAKGDQWVTNFGQRAWAADSVDSYYCWSQSYRTNDGACTNDGSQQRICGGSTYMGSVTARVCGAGLCILSAQ